MAWTNGGRTRTTTTAHRRWRTAVLTRDRYRCQQCGHQGRPGDGVMQADHILNVKRDGAEYDVDNGRALCVDCHKPKIQAEAAAGRAAKSTRRPARQHPGIV